MERVGGDIAPGALPCITCNLGATLTGPLFFPAVPGVSEVEEKPTLSCLRGSGIRSDLSLRFDDNVSHGVSEMRDDAVIK